MGIDAVRLGKVTVRSGRRYKLHWPNISSCWFEKGRCTQSGLWHALYLDKFLVEFWQETDINVRRLHVTLCETHVVRACAGVKCLEGRQVAGHSEHSPSLFSYRRLSRHRGSGAPSLTYLLTYLLTRLLCFLSMFRRHNSKVKKYLDIFS